jgi:RNA polymerase sigma factor (sigma-70 family)
MASQIAAVLRYLRHAAREQEHPAQSDAGLLQQFVTQRSEGAFAALLERYGPLVFAVCRRVLHDPAEAEDAFQAAFLVLARKAGSIRKQESLAAWLHRVALNISRTTKTANARRQAHERQAVLMSATTGVGDREPPDWQPMLHEEVDRLPEKYRVPVILCYLEGETHEAAARQLDWPVGTVKGRLARARDLLRRRLIRRGLILSSAGLAALLAESAGSAAVPPALLGLTLRAAVSFGAVGASAGAGASVQAISLAKGVIQAMTAKKLAHVILPLLAAGLLGIGAALGTGAWQETGPNPPTADNREPALKEKKAKLEAGPVVEKDGVRFEFLIPDRNWRIPKDAPRIATRVSLGLRITNRTQKPLRFSAFATLAPEMLGPNGKALQRVRGADGTYVRKETDCPLVKPGESVTFSSQAMLMWRNGRLEFGAEGALWGGFWHFGDLQPGRYRLRLRYTNASNEFMLSVGQPPGVLQGVWKGEIETPFVEVVLAQPVAGEKSEDGQDGVQGELKPQQGAQAEEARKRLEDLIKEDLKKLEGTWHMVGCEEGGKVFAPERVNSNDFLTLSGTKFYFKSGLRGLKGDFTIDPSKNPKWMDHIAVGGKLVLKGIYEFEGEKLRVFFGAPGGERPNQFKTKAGEKTWLRTYERVKASGRGHTREVGGVALSADGKHVLTGSWDPNAILWTAVPARPLRTFQGHTQLVVSVAFSADGKHLVTGSHDQTAILWDAATGRILQTFEDHSAEVSGVALSADGKRLLTGSWDDTAILWDTATGKKLQTFRGHRGIVTGVALSADGTKVVTTSTDKTAILWDTATGNKLQTFQGHASVVFSVALSSDTKHVVTGSEDRTAILWEASTGKPLQTFQGHTADVHSVALSADGKRVLTGSRDKTAILWESTTGKRLQTFQGHDGELSSVALSADGKLVVTGSYDSTAILWDAATGKKLQTFSRHTKS